ncbi:MAG: hypothetical protein PWP16_1297 [Eubacteriaceae bacterium]|jgi:hypothetical protein|nr:hypothetical protein [Eubacteriaceae bacterium]MDK2903998.1 hypothetical protein [Eubacteriaceae bacterium]MDK2936614.1 hypothetical protein [Eubacteriaceae bacterium]MDK2961044.1 hypothetical protein [Eubacteriaceae bacterium]MDN5307934.1 hypothetical protein [Eubacteriaceae bacterium]
MFKKTLSFFTSTIMILCFMTGCTSSAQDYDEAYISLISVPIDATIPDVLTLDSILSVTNPDPNNPEANLPAVTFAVFGYTNEQGEIEYYAYGKKEAVIDGELVQVEEGFYPIGFFRDNNTISVTLDIPAQKMTKSNPGTGTVTAYSDVPPFDFYTATETPGLFTFVDANGNTNFRVYATFDTGGNFYPANEDGTMITGALPIVSDYETTLQSAGTNAAARLLATPIACTNVQVIYKL